MKKFANLAVLVLVALMIAFVAVEYTKELSSSGGSNTLTPQSSTTPPTNTRPTLYLQAAPTTALGEQIKVDVYVKNMPDFSGVQLSVAYDQGFLRYDKAVEGTFLNSGSSTFFFEIKSAEKLGLVKDIVIVRKDGNIKGEGLIASLYFTSLKKGATDLKFSEVLLTNTAVEKLTADLVNTNVVIN